MCCIEVIYMKKIVAILGILSVLSFGVLVNTPDVEKTTDSGTIQTNSVADPGGNGGR